VACALISLNASAQTPSWWGKEVVSTSMAANRPRVSTTDYNNAVLIWGEGPHLVAGVTAVGGIGAFMRTDTINLTGHSVSISFRHGPEIASRGTDTVYVVYKVAPEADASHHIYCASTSMAQNYPRLDARFGQKMMVWKTGAGTQAKVQARLHILDTLYAFDVDTGTVNVPDVAVSGQGAFVVWHEVLEKRIYLKRLFYQSIGLPESVVSPSRQLVHTVDLYGRLVDPAQIPSGIYIQWYSDGSYEKVWLDE